MCWVACDDLFMDAAGKGSSQDEGVGNIHLSFQNQEGLKGDGPFLLTW